MSCSFSTIDDVWRFLDTIPTFQKSGASASNFALDNILKFCDAIGNPHTKYSSIHVAGTNGKGTTCHLLESVYTAANIKTGVFTSPHLIVYNERFRINGENCPDTKLLEFFQRFEHQLVLFKLTYFEISTAFAFWYFADQQVELAIIETGLGGRLDSTNIITPEVSIITSIGLDHQNVLGDTEAAITREKAGIIKQNVPVILGNIWDENAAIIEEIAESKQAKVFKTSLLQPHLKDGNVRLNDEITPIKTPLLESVNAWNIAVVYRCISVLKSKFAVNEEVWRKAIAEFEGVTARFQKLHPALNWYFSGAHNVQALQSTVQTVANLPENESIVYVLSFMKDKLNPEIGNIISSFKHCFYYQLEGERAAIFNDVANLIDVKPITDNDFKTILNDFDTSLVIFAGSFYFYSTVRRWINEITSINLPLPD